VIAGCFTKGIIMRTREDIEYAAEESGLSADAVAVLAGEDREELTANACKVAVMLGIKPKGRHSA
jgi:hypothetical protein